MCGSQGCPQIYIQSVMLLSISYEMHSFVLNKNLQKKTPYLVQFYISVLRGQKSPFFNLSLHVSMRMAWHKSVFYSCKIYNPLLPLPVVLVSLRHSVTDSLVLGEETIGSSSLSFSELQASKFYLQILHWSHQDSSLTGAFFSTHIHFHKMWSFWFGSGSAPSSILSCLIFLCRTWIRDVSSQCLYSTKSLLDRSALSIFVAISFLKR